MMEAQMGSSQQGFSSFFTLATRYKNSSNRRRRSIRNFCNTANPSTHIRLNSDVQIIRKIHIPMANHADTALVVSYKK